MRGSHGRAAVASLAGLTREAHRTGPSKSLQDAGPARVRGRSGSTPRGTTMKKTVKKAIDRSISHDEIVTIEGGAPELNELSGLCNDSTQYAGEENTRVHEFWGEDDDGNAWRVHVVVDYALQQL